MFALFLILVLCRNSLTYFWSLCERDALYTSSQFKDMLMTLVMHFVVTMTVMCVMMTSVMFLSYQ